MKQGRKNRVAKNPSFPARMNNTDPQRLLSRGLRSGGGCSEEKKKSQKQTRQKSSQKFVLIEKTSSAELVGRGYPKPIPKKMEKFHQEVRGKTVFLISFSVWNKHKAEITNVIIRLTMA